MTRYRIGAIDYLNSLPLNYYLEESLKREQGSSSFEIILDHPATLNRMIGENSLHVSPISSIYYAIYHENLYILPHLSISSYKAVHSVLLFSRTPLHKIQAVALSNTSATSIYQLKILLSNLVSHQVQYILSPPDLEKMLARAPAALLIGDDALEASRRKREDIHVYDMGTLWYEMTGEMMVHAFWVVPKEIAREDPYGVAMLHRSILKARDKGLSSLPDLLGQVDSMSREEANRYYSHLYYGLGEKELKGLLRFFQEAYQLDLLKEKVKLNFWRDIS